MRKTRIFPPRGKLEYFPAIPLMLAVINQAPSAMLCLRGVTITDLDSRKVPDLACSLSHRPSVTSIYTQLPRRFTGVENWPARSNLKCWHCDDIPENYPKFIPVEPEFVDGRRECWVLGHYCEWECAAADVSNQLPQSLRYDAHDLICIFESIFSLRPRKSIIVPAIPRTTMRAYCGDNGLTLSEWKHKVKTTTMELANHKLADISSTGSRQLPQKP